VEAYWRYSATHSLTSALDGGESHAGGVDLMKSEQHSVWGSSSFVWRQIREKDSTFTRRIGLFMKLESNN
jgi:hypothetical protein